jgi:hypothetical protein
VLHAEAAALTAALRSPVSCPPPYVAETNLVNGRSAVRFSLPLDPQPVTLPPALSQLAGALDRLDTALSMIGGIKQSRQLDERSFQLCLKRGLPTSTPGLFRVVQRFSCLIDNLSFEPGVVIDASLVGNGNLQRLLTSGRHLRPTTLESAA